MIHQPCNSTGHIVAIELESGRIYGFRCWCDIATEKNISKFIPAWDKVFLERFLPDFLNPQMKGQRK